MKNKIAILLPVYNAEQFLSECLESILQQTYTNWLLFACDDGSKDNSLTILKEYAAKDERITFFENPSNLGIVGTRNRLLDVIPEDVDIIALMDSDDVCFPDRLVRQLDYLKNHPEVGCVSSCLEIIDENSVTTGYRHYPCDAEVIRKILPRTNVLAQPAMMLRKEVIIKTGKYAIDCPVCSDYEYWLRVLEHFDFANLSDPVIRYRISKGQIKQRKLKQSLLVSLAIQRNYYKRIHRMMPALGIFKQCAGMILFFLPSWLILKIFTLLTYKK